MKNAGNLKRLERIKSLLLLDLIAKAETRLTQMLQNEQPITRVEENYNRRNMDSYSEAEYLISYGTKWLA